MSTVQQHSQTAYLRSRWVYPAVHQHKWGPHGCPKRCIKIRLEYEMNLCVSCLSLLFRRAVRYTLLHILLLNPLWFKSQVQAFECSSFCFCRSQVLSFPSFSPFFSLSYTNLQKTARFALCDWTKDGLIYPACVCVWVGVSACVWEREKM